MWKKPFLVLGTHSVSKPIYVRLLPFFLEMTCNLYVQWVLMWIPLGMGQTKKYIQHLFFPKIGLCNLKVVLITLAYVHVSDKFGCNQLFDAIKTGWNTMIDTWDCLAIGRARVLVGPAASVLCHTDSGSRWLHQRINPYMAFKGKHWDKKPL